MVKTRSGTYIGPDVELKGKRALVQSNSRASTIVYVQFDDLWMVESHGWHRSKRKYWKLDKPTVFPKRLSLVPPEMQNIAPEGN